MNLGHYLTLAGTFTKVTRWRTRPLHHGYPICYYRYMANYVYLPKRRTVRVNKTLKVFASDALNSMHACYNSRLPRVGWILSTTWSPLKHSQRLHIEGNTLYITGTIAASLSSIHDMGSIRQLGAEFHARRLHFWLPWAQSILPTTRKPLEHSQRVRIEGHGLHIMGTIVAIAFTCTGYRYFTWTGYRSFAKYEYWPKQYGKFITW